MTGGTVSTTTVSSVCFSISSSIQVSAKYIVYILPKGSLRFAERLASLCRKARFALPKGSLRFAERLASQFLRLALANTSS
jgi:hypothetical protein